VASLLRGVFSLEQTMVDQKLKLRALLRAWAEGASPIPLVEAMIEADETEQAIVIARGALEGATPDDRARLLAILDKFVRWPPQWDALLDDISRDPTLERWEALHRFASGAAIYDWRRMALQKLRDRGVGPITLFEFASTGGVVPDAIGLVEEGVIPPERLVARANEPGAARSIWLGLAAQASFLRGDEVNTIRYIEESIACSEGFSVPDFSLLWLLDHVEDEALRARIERIWQRSQS